MVKKKQSSGSSMVWDMHTMFHCSIIMFFFGGLATLSFYRDYNQQKVSSNVKVTFITTTTITTKSNTHTDTNATSAYTNTTTSANTNTTTSANTNTATSAKANTTTNAMTNTTTSANTNTTTSAQAFDNLKSLKIALPSRETCDLLSGQWVYDNKSHYPLYKEKECPFMNGDLACQTYGRKDSKYQRWRWQPHGCDFPRFDGKAIVEILKDKRLLFVGDSVNRNQWASMMCMIYTSIPGKKKFGMGLNRTLYTFRANDFNISIDYYWAPMLVESNGDDPSNHRLDHRAVRIKSIEKHARHWVNADILVFNTYLWWRLPIIKLVTGPGSLTDVPSPVFDEIDNVHAYKMVLKTWSKWAHSNIDPTKTKSFFMGPTATHHRARDWGGKKTNSCFKEKEPVMVKGFWESGTDPKMLRVLEASLSKLKSKGLNVQLLNITQLTQYRKDAHPTIHKKIYRPWTNEEKNNPQRTSDCTHWCLPGVPDIWNELLLAYISRQ